MYFIFARVWSRVASFDADASEITRRSICLLCQNCVWEYGKAKLGIMAPSDSQLTFDCSN